MLNPPAYRNGFGELVVPDQFEMVQTEREKLVAEVLSIVRRLCVAKVQYRAVLMCNLVAADRKLQELEKMEKIT